MLVEKQERDLGVFFDTIVVCSVTGSTHAGMVAGFAALEQAGGNISHAAAALGITRAALYRRIEKFGL